MEPTDKSGRLRYEIRDVLGMDNPTGKRLDEDDYKRILRAIDE
jgi:hypothetical protein